MRPRVVFRTHYQVDEPAYLRVLLHAGTSPVRTAYSDTVAHKIAREVRRRGKEFNVPAAKYVVDLAHGLGVTTEQNVWTPQGHLLALMSPYCDAPWDQELVLDERERLAYLRVFLEGDGATLLYLARYVQEHRSVPTSGDDWNDLAQQMFLAIYQEYRDLAGTTADRVRLRAELDRIRREGYKGKSGAHKLFVHLQTMSRLGLLDRAEGAARRYIPGTARHHAPLAVLLDEFPGLYALEQAVRNARLTDAATRVLGYSFATHVANQEVLWNDLTALYRRIVATGVPLCPLMTLVDAAQIEGITSRGEALTHDTIQTGIEAAQRLHARDIRFHVDRRGQPAFVKLSDDWLNRHVEPAAR